MHTGSDGGHSHPDAVSAGAANSCEAWIKLIKKLSADKLNHCEIFDVLFLEALCALFC